ncbi:hypothetical protein ABPG75_000198 [Micractinium tetrahymenae]
MQHHASRKGKEPVVAACTEQLSAARATGAAALGEQQAAPPNEGCTGEPAACTLAGAAGSGLQPAAGQRQAAGADRYVGASAQQGHDEASAGTAGEATSSTSQLRTPGGTGSTCVQPQVGAATLAAAASLLLTPVAGATPCALLDALPPAVVLLAARCSSAEEAAIGAGSSEAVEAAGAGSSQEQPGAAGIGIGEEQAGAAGAGACEEQPGAAGIGSGEEQAGAARPGEAEAQGESSATGSGEEPAESDGMDQTTEVGGGGGLASAADDGLEAGAADPLQSTTSDLTVSYSTLIEPCDAELSELCTLKDLGGQYSVKFVKIRQDLCLNMPFMLTSLGCNLLIVGVVDVGTSAAQRKEIFVHNLRSKMALRSGSGRAEDSLDMCKYMRARALSHTTNDLYERCTRGEVLESPPNYFGYKRLQLIVEGSEDQALSVHVYVDRGKERQVAGGICTAPVVPAAGQAGAHHAGWAAKYPTTVSSSGGGSELDGGASSYERGRQRSAWPQDQLSKRLVTPAQADSLAFFEDFFWTSRLCRQRFREAFPGKKEDAVVQQLAGGIYAMRQAIGSGDAAAAKRCAWQQEETAALAAQLLQCMPFAPDQAAARRAQALLAAAQHGQG